MKLLILVVLFVLNTLGQAYRLENLRDYEFTRDPTLELFRYLNKWIDFRDTPSLDGIQPEVTYTFDVMPDEVSEEPPYVEKSDPTAQTTQYNLAYLSFLDKERLKSVGSIEEVAQITGLPLLPEEGDAEMTTVSKPMSGTRSSMLREIRTRGRPKKDQNDINFAKRAVCEPEKVSVSLPADEGFRVIPSCVRIKKCGGCCNPGLVCVATRTKPLKLEVMELALNNTTLMTKVLTDISEDLECGCQCGVREEHCLPTQDYDPNSCSCLCKAEREAVRTECEDSGRLWDAYRCTCQCPLQGPHSESDCGSGQTFNPSTCNCENV